jgi:hypothetical protein
MAVVERWVIECMAGGQGGAPAERSVACGAAAYGARFGVLMCGVLMAVPEGCLSVLDACSLLGEQHQGDF